MKKIVYFAALMVIATTAITSCIRPASSIKAGTTYELSFSHDLFDLCEVEVSYKGQDGTIKTETIAFDSISHTSDWWEKQVIHYSTPFNAYLAYHIKLKPGAQLTQDEYNAYLSYTVRTKWPHDSTRGASRIICSQTIYRDQIASFIDSLNRIGNPIVSLNVEDHGQLNLVKGEKQDIVDFNDLHRYGMTRHNSDDSTGLVEEEPVLNPAQDQNRQAGTD